MIQKHKKIYLLAVIQIFLFFIHIFKSSLHETTLNLRALISRLYKPEINYPTSNNDVQWKSSHSDETQTFEVARYRFPKNSQQNNMEINEKTSQDCDNNTAL